MAKTATRRINVYINDKEVEDSIDNIAKEFKKLNKETKKLEIGSEQYQKNIKRLRELDGELARHRKRVKGVEETWTKTKSALVGFGAGVIGALSIDAVTSFFSALKNESLDLFDVQAKADEQLRARLQSTDAIAGRSLEQLKAQAQALQEVTLFGDEQTQGAQSLLLTFTQVQTEVFDRTIVAAQDMATAFALANGGTADLKGATTQLGKALNDPIAGLSALSRSGVQFNEQQKELIKGFVKQGEIVKAQTVILDELETQFKGSAEAAALAGTGGIFQLQNKISDLKEEIGETAVAIETGLVRNQLRFYEVLRDGAVFLADVTGATQDYSESLEEERIQLNVLTNQITDTNITEDERRKVINQLNAQFPNFLKNLNAETVTNKEISDRLKEVNEQYINKIILQQEDERLQKQLEKVADKARNSAVQELEIEKLLAAAQRELKSDIDLTNKSFEERIEITRKALSAEAEFSTNQRSGINVARNEQAKILEDLTGKTIFLSQAQKRQAEQESALNDIQKEREAILKRLDINFEGTNKSPDDAGSSSPITPSDANVATQEKNIQRTIDNLARLRGELEKFEEDQRLAQLDTDDRELERIRLKYQKQIDEAKRIVSEGGDDSAEASNILLDLERIRDAEIDAYRADRKAEKDAKKAEQLEADKAQQQQINDEIAASLQAEADLKAEIQLQVDQELKSSLDIQLDQVNAHYAELISEADKYGIDITDLVTKYEAERKKITDEYNKKEVDAKIKTADDIRKVNEQRTRNEISAFKSFGDAVTGFIDEIDKEGSKHAEFRKTLALFQIGVDTASAISSLVAAASANPTNAVTFGAAGIAQFAAGLVQILANIAKAKSLLGPVPQRMDGGYYDVIGAQDGQQYNARYSGRPSGGILPGGPQLILANEKGPEYFVPTHLLQQPQVADAVRLIESIRLSRVPQRVDGGFSPTPQNDETGQINIDRQTEQNQQLMALNITLLQRLLAEGVQLKLSNSDAQDLLDYLNEVSESS